MCLKSFKSLTWSDLETNYLHIKSYINLLCVIISFTGLMLLWQFTNYWTGVTSVL